MKKKVKVRKHRRRTKRGSTVIKQHYRKIRASKEIREAYTQLSPAKREEARGRIIERRMSPSEVHKYKRTMHSSLLIDSFKKIKKIKPPRWLNSWCDKQGLHDFPSSMKKIAYSLVISNSQKELENAHAQLFYELKEQFKSRKAMLDISKKEIKEFNNLQSLHLIYYISAKLRKELKKYLNKRCAENVDYYRSCNELLKLLIKDKDVDKEVLIGGKADNIPIEEYDKEQLAIGLYIESEHTKDPMAKLEISADHLEEAREWFNKKYYFSLLEMEEKSESDTNEKD